MTTAPNIDKPRILVIDDDESIREMLSLTLEEEGYIVDTAKNGEDAIAKSHSKLYNLAIVDWRLPDIEGTNLLPKLKPTTPRMAKVMLTGFPSAKNAMEAAKNGADAFMVKPIEPPILLEKIRDLLKKQQQTQENGEAQTSEFTETRARELIEKSHFRE